MTTTKHLHKIHKHTNIKIMMMLLVLVIGFGFHGVFAADVGEKGNFLGELSGIIDSFFQLASRLWIPLATLAGKFMSNDMIYGSWLHMDTYLWQMRNMSKNFANFGIVGFLLIKIVQSIVGKKNELKSLISKAVVGGIVIQMSRFLTAAIIDISTIATTAIGSLPASLLSSSTLETEMKTMIETSIMKSKLIIDQEGNVKLGKNDDVSLTTDNIKNMLLPKYDSISGPLMFVGASVLNIQEMKGIDENAKRDAKSMIINFGIKGFILIMFIVILGLLLIANIIRVGYLWIFVITSPLVVLFTVLGDRKSGLLKSSFLKDISLKNFVTMVFKPTLFVAILGLLLVFTISLKSMLNDNVANINGVSIMANNDGTTSFNIEGVTSVTTNETIIANVGNDAKSIISTLILYFVTIFLLRFVVKVSLGSGDDPISTQMKKSTKFIEEAAADIKLPGGLSYNNMRTLGGDMANSAANAAAKGIFSDDINFNLGSGTFKSDAFDDYMDELRGTANGRSKNDMKELSDIAEKGGDFLGQTKTIIGRNGKWISKGSEKTIQLYDEWKELFDKWSKKDKAFNNKTFSELKKEDFEKLHGMLGGSKKDIPTDETSFKETNYAKQ